MSVLTGKRVLNTRAVEQQAALDQLLLQRGAIPISFPCIAIESLASTAELDAELRRAAVGDYAWVLFTSVNTASSVEQRLRALDLRLSACVGAVGETTAAAVERWLGRPVDFVSGVQRASALAASLPVSRGDHVLIPTSTRARSDLAETLRRREAHPRVVEAYRTVEVAGGWRMVGQFDAVAFASPSAVTGFLQRMIAGGLRPRDLERVAIGCIGPATFHAAIDAGFSTAIQALTHSLDGLVAAIEHGISTIAEREASTKS